MRTALITGASRGIGKELALGLAGDGWKLGLVARDNKKLNSLAEILNKQQGEEVAWAFPGDVSDEKFAKETLLSISEKISPPSLLINNAAVHHSGSLELDYKEFDELMKVNVRGVFNFSKQAVSQLKKSSNAYIINISSLAGKIGFSGTGGYSASKFAVSGLSESLFHELASDGIKVTSICPSWVDTDMARHSGIPGSEMIEKEDILKTVRYLLSLSKNAVPKEIVISCAGFI